MSLPLLTAVALAALVNEPFTLEWKGGEPPPVKVIDFGPDGVGGYPVVEAEAIGKEARLRLSYGCVPGIGDGGDFSRATSARYLGPTVDLPILPASVDRFDVFSITNAGTYAAPLQQGLVRYVRVRLDTPGTAVKVAAVRFENRGTHSTEPVVGSFAWKQEYVFDLTGVQPRIVSANVGQTFEA